MHLDPRNKALALRPWKTIRGHAGMARLNSECLDVGFVECFMSTNHEYPQTVGVMYHKPSGRLVITGGVKAFSSDRQAYVLGDASTVKWRQAKAVAPIAKRYGATVTVSRTYYADWEAGDMQGTLKAPRPRVRIQ